MAGRAARLRTSRLREAKYSLDAPVMLAAARSWERERGCDGAGCLATPAAGGRSREVSDGAVTCGTGARLSSAVSRPRAERIGAAGSTSSNDCASACSASSSSSCAGGAA
jgi:hypothetical protein